MAILAIITKMKRVKGIIMGDFALLHGSRSPNFIAVVQARMMLSERDVRIRSQLKMAYEIHDVVFGQSLIANMWDN